MIADVAPNHHIDLASFALAGHAVFTVRNSRTGGRFTFQVTGAKDNPTLFFVAVLGSPDNEHDYRYLGTIRGRTYTHGRKARVSPDAPSAVAFAWLWAHRDHLPAAIEVFHEGRCGRCGRTLTTPESVTQGYGPACMKHVEAA